MTGTQPIKKGYRYAAAITKKHAETFYFASHFLPKEKRRAAYAVYAVCRRSDDTVDSHKATEAHRNLNDFARSIDRCYGEETFDDPLLCAFRETVQNYGIPNQYFDELLQGMQMDLQKNRYDNFDELSTYCYRVAGVVGLIMTKIFGYRDSAAETHAVQLGIAMQLTNILRDVKEDYERGRIYLPKDEMDHFGIEERHLYEGTVTSDFKDLMKFQIARARKYYQASARGIRLITDKKSRFVIRAMKEMYADILGAIENKEYDIFRSRAHTTLLDKIIIISKLLLEEDADED